MSDEEEAVSSNQPIPEQANAVQKNEPEVPSTNEIPIPSGQASPTNEDLDKIIEEEFAEGVNNQGENVEVDTSKDVEKQNKKEALLPESPIKIQLCEFCKAKPSVGFHPTERKIVPLPTGQNVSVSQYWCGTCTSAAPKDETGESMHCKFCSDAASQVCPTCKMHFCVKHSSYIDRMYCRECLDEGKIEMKTEPIVDNEGVTHQGTHYIPVGEAVKSLPRIVSEMSDDELRNFLQACREDVRRYEKGRDYSIVKRSVAELETKHREHQKINGLRGVKISVGGGTKVISTSAKKGEDPYAALAKKLQAAGFTKEMMQSIVDKSKKK